MDDIEARRHQMVQSQIAARGLGEQRLLAAFEATPRHLFVPPKLRHLAYADRPLPIGHGQTISQPYIVALMTSMLELQGTERVLDIGTGSGYQAAILARMCQEVHTVELVPELAESAGNLLRELGLGNVHCHVGDGSLGWAGAAPYSGIVVTAAAPHVPQPLLDQLAEGGRLVIPVGAQREQVLEAWDRRRDQFIRRAVTGVRFVPLRGRHGWSGKFRGV